MKPQDDDLFKPLSAKAGRKQYTSGGREKGGTCARSGDGRRWQQFLQKRASKGPARRAKVPT